MLPVCTEMMALSKWVVSCAKHGPDQVFIKYFNKTICWVFLDRIAGKQLYAMPVSLENRVINWNVMILLLLNVSLLDAEEPINPLPDTTGMLHGQDSQQSDHR